MVGVLAFILLGLSLVVGLVSLACFVYNIVVAFQQGDTVAGILSICGIIGFILGWVNVEKWGHRNVMIVWSIAIIAGLVLQGLSMALMPALAG
ncbi:MAG: hypothetical protein Q8M16_11625 [Pirellulaceae bacterium]|nr:hypothetical protein [Pirellulaceae bacterium]